VREGAVHDAVVRAPPTPQQVEAVLLKALNAARDVVINPEIHKEIPDPIKVDIDQKGSASAGCIIPSPFGCICHASASYDVHLDTLHGVNTLNVTNFTGLSGLVPNNVTSWNVTVDGTMLVNNMGATGGAHAGVDACHISPSVSGSASTEVDASGSVAITGMVTFDVAKNCLTMHVDKMSDSISHANVHDTHVKIDLGPIPGIDVGSLVDLVLKMVPQITEALEGPISGAIAGALPSVLNEALACIPL